MKTSGAAVRGAVLTGGISAVSFAFIIGPWVKHWLDAKALKYGVVLPDGYHEAFITALSSAVLYASAALKVFLADVEQGLERAVEGPPKVTP